MAQRFGYEGPGLYRHYKGGTYTVLFLAEVVGDTPNDHGSFTVYVLTVTARGEDRGNIYASRGGVLHAAHTVPLFFAEDSTDKKRPDDKTLVLYVSHQGHGLRARKLTEFNEYVEMDVPRFRKEG